MPEPTRADGLNLDSIRRRTIGVLAIGQVLGGIAFGATISLGAVLAAEMSGDESLSGLAAAAVTLGAAALAVPLASLAARRGRRLSLSAGMLIALLGVGMVIVAVLLDVFPLLLLAFALIGAGQAANLQSRFAATDLATDASRGRDLSLVVWATTIGAVLGPNLVGPGEALGAMVGMPELTGPYLFTVAAQLLGVALYLVALRPDPLLLAHRLAGEASSVARAIVRADQPTAARYAITAIAASHGVMVAVMSMTPVHLMHHGAELSIVGLTISLHIAGMYALSPLFGFLADRAGRVPTILLGQGLLTLSLIVAALGQSSTTLVTIALVLLGLGWSASTVAGSALLTESSSESRRTQRQGRSDLAMNLVGAFGAIAAGGVLGFIGYGGLALVALAAVAVVVVLSPAGRRSKGAPLAEAAEN
ncbi:MULTISPECIES: MFS transporter [unclassified Microbacterium]|uniref:MFS transporter n=1 Tax=unclassified Microbacterium TaxID=2609290 RepID=UPI00214AA5D3|nr:MULTISPECIES: MFS transporter [unclassified Microbacterium]MCR2784588.1 MFS transporter [Microbacterium sp. zg.B96]MDL5350493.1 MFS transporter [Microbacterium sp. zg-YB36]WIM14604.1 MFS transporter [Microbacterium sp. zg-B96]